MTDLEKVIEDLTGAVRWCVSKISALEKRLEELEKNEKN